MKKIFKVFLSLIFFSTFFLNYAEAKKISYSCIDNYGESFFDLDTKKKSIFYTEPGLSTFLNIEIFEDDLVRGYLFMKDIVHADPPTYEFWKPFIEKDWKELDKQIGRPMTLKEKVIINTVVKRYLETRFYIQLDLKSREYIVTSTPVNFDDLHENILEIFPIDQMTSKTYTVHGTCKLIN